MRQHLAAAVANQALDRGEPVLFTVVPDLLDHLRATFGPTSEVGYDARFEQVRTTGLLVLDDLGTDSATGWAREKLYQIVNYRYTARRSDQCATIDTALERGDELTDEQIRYLHLHRQWSPTRPPESRGVRGRKQARLERVYAALGERPASPHGETAIEHPEPAAR